MSIKVVGSEMTIQAIEINGLAERRVVEVFSAALIRGENHSIFVFQISRMDGHWGSKFRTSDRSAVTPGL